MPIDLETICLKALRKDPRQRYRTAAEFRDDMARWLAGEAILASPPSWTDRVLRRVKRHAPRSLAMAAGIAIVIAVGWWLLLRSEAAGWAREADAKATSGDWQAARSLLDRARTRIAIDEELYRKVDAELKAREAEVARRAEIERVFGGVFAWLDSMPAYPINWKAGVRRLDEALRQMPGHADGWKRKGELHISLQQPDEALEAFGRAIAIAPTPVLHYLRGRIQLDAKRDKAAARTEFDAALRLDPSHQFSRLAQIRLAMMEGRRDEALRLCAESERHCSGFAQFFEVRAMARWMPPATPEDTAEVVRDFETAAAMADVDPSALLNLAMLKMGRDSGRALDLVNRAIEMAPNYALAHTYRALVRRALRDYDQALADAERALIINPSLPESVSAHALLLHDRGRTGEAIAQWKRALDLGGPLWDKRAQVMRWIDEAEKRK